MSDKINELEELVDKLREEIDDLNDDLNDANSKIEDLEYDLDTANTKVSKYEEVFNDYNLKPKISFNKNDLHTFLCDRYGLNYHTKNEDVVSLVIKELVNGYPVSF